MMFGYGNVFDVIGVSAVLRIQGVTFFKGVDGSITSESEGLFGSGEVVVINISHGGDVHGVITGVVDSGRGGVTVVTITLIKGRHDTVVFPHTVHQSAIKSNSNWRGVSRPVADIIIAGTQLFQ